jgi:hypothetical protein
LKILIYYYFWKVMPLSYCKSFKQDILGYVL